MRVRGWSIDGFGLFHHYQVTDLPDGLTVIYGPNEAGKSTLLAFLCGALFGFGARNGTPPPYPPLRGGRHGGRLFLAATDGDYTVERDIAHPQAPQIVGPGGRAATPADLRSVLGGVDAELFRAVFAFSVAELHAFELLDHEAVRERIFSASIAGAGRSARAVIATLQRRAANVLAEQGGARINALVGELNQLRARRDAARREAMDYPARRAAARQSGAAVAALQQSLAAARATRAQAALLVALAPSWSALCERRRWLDALELIDDIPDQAATRLALVREQLATAHTELAALETEQGVAQAKQSALQPPPGGAPPGALERLQQDLGLHRARLSRCAAARVRDEETERRLSEKLEQMGAGWSIDQLGRCYSSRAVRAVLRGWVVRPRAAAATVQHAEREVAECAVECAARRGEYDAAARALAGGAPLPAAALEAQRQALRGLRENLEAMRREQARGESIDRTAQDREYALRSPEGAGAPGAPAWLAGALWAAMAAALAAMAWRTAVGDSSGVLVLSVAAAALGAAAYGARQMRGWADERARQRAAEFRALRSEVHEARRARDAQWRRAAERLEAIAQDAASLGLSRLPSLQAVDERAEELMRAEGEHAAWNAAQQRVQELAQVLRAVEQNSQAKTAHLETARAAAAALRDAWTEWKAARGLPADLVVERAAELLAEVREAQGLLAARAERAVETAELESAIAAWEAAARAALAAEGAVDVGGLAGDLLADEVLAARQRMQRAEAERLALARLEGEIRTRGARIAEAAAAVRRWETEREELLRRARAADEADFERRCQVARRRRELGSAIASLEQELENGLAVASDAPALRAALAAGQPDEWRQGVAAADAQLAELEEQLVAAAERHHAAKERCRVLETAHEMAELETEWTALTAELDAAVREWRVLALAEGLVETALQAFERDRQPAVLAAASQTFAAVTGGRYPRVLQDDSGHALVVVDSDGVRKRVPDELSRGTAEQLYLSLRLGLAAELARGGTPLPLIMDDVLVNFDPPRAAAMAQALGEFARHHQVLFFTCHPSTRAMLGERGHAARIVEI